MARMARDDEGLKGVPHRAGATHLEQRTSEKAPGADVFQGNPAAVSQPTLGPQQLLHLQRYAGNRAVQSLMRTSTATARPLPLQRLAFDKAIRTRDIQDVLQVPNKSTFILTGNDDTKVVVKFEGTSESQAGRKARLNTTNKMAKNVLGTLGVPSFNFLSDDELNALAQFDGNGGAGVNTLKQSAALVVAGSSPDTGIKLPFLSLGEDLGKMKNQSFRANLKPGKRPKTPPGWTNANQLLTTSKTVWKDFGRMAAFDLFIGNDDRFAPSGKQLVNLENLDFTGGKKPSAVALDNFNPLGTIGNMKGQHVPKALKDEATANQYAEKACTYICLETNTPPAFAYDFAFRDGFLETCVSIRKERGRLEKAAKKSTITQEQAEYFQFLIGRIDEMSAP